MRVKFTSDYLYETEGRGKGAQFKAGQMEDFRDDVAQRFIKRLVAVRADGPGAAAAAPPPRPDARSEVTHHGGGSGGGKPAGEGGKPKP